METNKEKIFCKKSKNRITLVSLCFFHWLTNIKVLVLNPPGSFLWGLFMLYLCLHRCPPTTPKYMLIGLINALQSPSFLNCMCFQAWNLHYTQMTHVQFFFCKCITETKWTCKCFNLGRTLLYELYTFSHVWFC